MYRVVSSLTERGARKLANIAITSHLYIEGWMLIRFLEKLRENSFVALCYYNDDPIGVVVTYPRYGGKTEVMAFVRPEHRRKGVGTMLVNKAKARLKNEIGYSAGRGIDGSLKFWERVKVEA